MSHAWIAVTHLTEDGYRKLVEEREARLATDGDGGNGSGGR
jgi:hypothetical protein